MMRCVALVVFAFSSHMPVNAQTPVNIRLLDGSNIRCFTVTESLIINTNYGPLVIPFTDITLIRFALRANDSETKQLIEASRKLNSQVFLDREISKKMFMSLGRLSVPTLLIVSKSTDRDVSTNAKLLLQSITDKDPREVVEFDRVETTMFPSVGKIKSESLTFRSPILDELVVQIGKIESLAKE